MLDRDRPDPQAIDMDADDNRDPRKPSASNPASIVKTPKTALARMYAVTKLGRAGRLMKQLANGRRNDRSPAR